ncbi:hypothetical protein HYV85_02930 [Candidatus Woesearchaeota archaeon]|nr:hypothetical protein [Candidatus Woesearchaeota archaeon]
MVKETKKGGKAYYICGECGFAYETKELAQKCEDWCREHHSCSLEITKHAINLKQQTSSNKLL